MSAFKRAEENNYGFRSFDLPNDFRHGEDDEDEEGEEFDLDSCARDCCDNDCECDDCLRCSSGGVRTDDDDYFDFPFAAG